MQKWKLLTKIYLYLYLFENVLPFNGSSFIWISFSSIPCINRWCMSNTFIPSNCREHNSQNQDELLDWTTSIFFFLNFTIRIYLKLFRKVLQWRQLFKLFHHAAVFSCRYDCCFVTQWCRNRWGQGGHCPYSNRGEGRQSPPITTPPPPQILLPSGITMTQGRHFTNKFWPVPACPFPFLCNQRKFWN